LVTQYQTYELSQATLTLPYPYGLSVTSHTARISRFIRTHTAAWPAKCKVCTTRQAQPRTQTTVSRFLLYSLHRAKRTHTTGDQTFEKGVVVDSFSLALVKIQTYFQKRSTEKIFGQTTFKKRPKKAKRPTQKSYGQST